MDGWAQAQAQATGLEDVGHRIMFTNLLLGIAPFDFGATSIGHLYQTLLLLHLSTRGMSLVTCTSLKSFEPCRLSGMFCLLRASGVSPGAIWTNVANALEARLIQGELRREQRHVVLFIKVDLLLMFMPVLPVLTRFRPDRMSDHPALIVNCRALPCCKTMPS